jgi:hypothetical protein
LQLEEEIARLDEKEMHLQTAWNPATEESQADFDTLAAPLVEEGGTRHVPSASVSAFPSLLTKASSTVEEAATSSSEPPESLEPVGSGVGLAIWLGMLIDGIPEALVIGTSQHNNV